jgi:uncharacterized protein YjdB
VLHRVFGKPARFLSAGLAVFVLILWSCNTNDANVEREFSLSPALIDSLSAYDSVKIVLKDPKGGPEDTIYKGPPVPKSNLEHISAAGYQGGEVLITVLGFKNDRLAYEVVRRYDGAKTDSTAALVLPGDSLAYTPADLRVIEGAALPLPAITVLPANLSDKTLSWQSSDVNIAVVEKDSLRGVAPGDAVLEARLKTDLSQGAVFKVKVVSKAVLPESLAVEPDSIGLAVRSAPGRLTAKVSPASASAAVAWSSDDSSVASVDSQGNVTGLKQGETRVRAVSRDNPKAAGSAKVVVSAAVQVESVEIIPDSIEVYAGGTAEILAARVLPALANPAVDWTLTDSTVAAMDAGKVQGLKEGATYAYARSREDKGKYDSARVVVRPLQKVDSVTLDRYALKLYLGGAPAVLAATVHGTDSLGKVHWYSRAASVAVVDDSGRVTPVSPGKALIEAVSRADSAHKAVAEVTVKKDTPIPDVGGDTTVGAGREVVFDPRVTQEYGTMAEFRWDLDGDGTWDSTSADVHPVSHTYAQAKTYLAHFYFRDGENNDTMVVKKVKVVKGPIVKIVKPEKNSYFGKAYIDTVIWEVDGVVQNQFTNETLGHEGANSLSRKFTDSLGNEFYDSITVYLDTQAPNKPQATGSPWSNTRLPTWTWISGGNGGSGSYRYRLDDENLAGISPVSDTSYTAATELTESVHTLYVQERDLAGNWSAVARFAIKIDTTRPAAPVPAPGHQALSNEARPLFRWVPVGGGGGAARVYRCATDTSKGFKFIDVDSSSYRPGKDLPEGLDTLFVQERDSAGNWSNFGFMPVRVDLTSPAAPVVTSVLQSPTVNAKPAWTWRTGGNGGAGTFRYKLDDVQLGGQPETSDTAYTPADSLAEGLHTLYVQERDAAGNWSASGPKPLVVALRKGQTALSVGVPKNMTMAASKNGKIYAGYSESSQFYNYYVKSFDGNQWSLLGNMALPYQGSYSAWMTLGEDGLPVVATSFSNYPQSRIRLSRFNGAGWDSIAAFQTGQDVDTLTLAAGKGGKYYVAYHITNEVTVKVACYNGASWVDLDKNGYVWYGGKLPSLAVNPKGDPYVAMHVTSGAGTAELGIGVFTLADSAWVKVGPTVQDKFRGAFAMTLDGNGVPYVAYQEPSGQKATVVRLKAGQWDTVGTRGFTANQSDGLALAIGASGMPVVASAYASNSISAYGFAGGAWKSMGQVGQPSGGETSMALDPNDVPYIIFSDYAHSSQAAVMKTGFDP